MGVIPYSPLDHGLLGGVLQKASTGRRATEWNQKRIEEHRDQLEAYEKLCADLGQDPASVALAWLLHRPGVTSPIVGPRTMEQLDASIAALDVELAEETRQDLDRIWPGPGGPAPEAFAW
jgi:aryl-alcohol dehydrogenase-like predicted oxidoreductase